MIKFMGLLRRKEGMPVADFQAYWREMHGPLMAKAPGMRRYVQNHTLPELYEGEKPPIFDGISEAWFDSLEDLNAARDSLEWKTGSADAPNLLAGGNPSLLVTEVPVIDAFPKLRDRQSMVKWVTFLTRKPNMPVADFQAYWRDKHGPRVAAGSSEMRRYVQNHPLPELYAGPNPPPYDGIPTAWFDSLEAQRKPRNSSGDHDDFLNDEPVPSIIVREVVMISDD